MTVCGLCGDAIEPGEEWVTPSRAPWRLPDVRPDAAHHECADVAARDARDGEQAREDAYRRAMGGPDGLEA